MTKVATRKFKMGRRRPASYAPALRLGHYVDASLPAPPVVAHYSQDKESGLAMILGNDTLGDCTAAGAGHIVDVSRGNSGNGAACVTQEQAIAFYSASTGYVPGDPSTDQGGDEITVLNTWRDKGYFADGSGKIEGYARVDPSKPEEIKAALYLFENVYFGVDLPDAWVNPEPTSTGFVWGVAGDPDSNNGHCFVGVGYNDVGVQIATWGMIGTITWDAIAKYASRAAAGDLFVAFGEDAISKATGKTKAGFNASQLAADLKAISWWPSKPRGQLLTTSTS
jgi:hypothetical protein